MSEELIRAKKCDIRWIILHLNEIIEYMEASEFFDESDLDYPIMSLAYHSIFEIKESLTKQYDNYPKST